MYSNRQLVIISQWKKEVKTNVVNGSQFTSNGSFFKSLQTIYGFYTGSGCKIEHNKTTSGKLDEKSCKCIDDIIFGFQVTGIAVSGFGKRHYG